MGIQTKSKTCLANLENATPDTGRYQRIKSQTQISLTWVLALQDVATESRGATTGTFDLTWMPA